LSRLFSHVIISFSGKPDPVKDCSVTNKTFTSIHIECKPGYDGGLQQSFVVEVFPVGAIDASGSVDGGASLVAAGALEGVGVGEAERSALASPIVRLENRHFPNFYVEDLEPGTAFGMVAYAQNSKVNLQMESNCHSR
jgi:hypothetical protein